MGAVVTASVHMARPSKTPCRVPVRGSGTRPRLTSRSRMAHGGNSITLHTLLRSNPVGNNILPPRLVRMFPFSILRVGSASASIFLLRTLQPPRTTKTIPYRCTPSKSRTTQDRRRPARRRCGLGSSPRRIRARMEITNRRKGPICCSTWLHPHLRPTVRLEL